ncbi:MAG TPA: TRAP transporter small permease [Beijerinckiaceae bacterium]|nr:TRAP transporter small permease [Beijerinckiaceae bacterium]
MSAPLTEPPQPAARPGYAGPRLAAAAEALALAGGILMLVVACLVTLSVLMRWLAGDGIAGDFELVQIATGVGAFAFLPLCQARRGNVIVDTFTTRLPQRARDGLDAVWDLTYAVLMAVIGWRLVIGAQDAFASHTTSMVLGIPQGYAVAACAVMGVFVAIVAAATALRFLKARA